MDALIERLKELGGAKKGSDASPSSSARLRWVKARVLTHTDMLSTNA